MGINNTAIPLDKFSIYSLIKNSDNSDIYEIYSE